MTRSNRSARWRNRDGLPKFERRFAHRRLADEENELLGLTRARAHLTGSPAWREMEPRSFRLVLDAGR